MDTRADISLIDVLLVQLPAGIHSQCHSLSKPTNVRSVRHNVSVDSCM